MASVKKENKFLNPNEINDENDLSFIDYKIIGEIDQEFLATLIDRVRQSNFKVNAGLPKKSIYRQRIDLINSGNSFVDWVCFIYLFAKGNVECDSKLLKQFDKVIWSFSIINIYLFLNERLLPHLNGFQESYFFSILEGDNLDSLWLSKVRIKIANACIEDIFTLSDYFCYFDRVNRHTLFLKGDLFAKNKECLDMIGSLITEKLKEILSLNNKKRKLSVDKIALVVGRVFTKNNIKNNSHYLSAMGFLKLIDAINEQRPEKDKIGVGVFFTGEKTFSHPSVRMGISEDIDTQYVYDLMRENCKSISHLNVESVENHSSRSDMLYKSYCDIEQFDPDVLMFLGGTYDSKIIRYKCYTSYPVVFLPTTASVDNSYGKPDDYADLIRYINDDHYKSLQDLGIEKEKLFYTDKPVFRMDSNCSDEVDWDDCFSFPIENPFLMLTPLVGTRISAWLSSLESQDEEIISKTFQDNPDLCWILLGNNKEKLLKVFSKKTYLQDLYNGKRIYILEYTDKIESLIKRIDLLFIPTLGARTTIGLGAHNLKPSIIPIGSDAEKIVAQESLFSDISSAFFNIDRCISDHSFYSYLSNHSYELQKVNDNYSVIAVDFLESVSSLLKRDFS
ncbi:hypothetical protein P0F01_002628 [Vibrio metschnikovii]|nr:hypothetical protein [Vibrio metschnikovii]EKO3586355.1 hypothetical protein [Vibrio metschnikovii]ELF5343545.1 hypothetical protein [Vibrio metschnikovii]